MASTPRRIPARKIVTVTQHPCRWCGRSRMRISAASRSAQACRQRDYEARHRARELGLGEDELVITRTQLESVQDRLYVLARTVEDADVTVPGGGPGRMRRCQLAAAGRCAALQLPCGNGFEYRRLEA